MIKLALSNKLVNALAKKVIAKFLAKKLGTDSKITINELSAEEANGRVKLKMNMELDISENTAVSLIDSL